MRATAGAGQVKELTAGIGLRKEQVHATWLHAGTQGREPQISQYY